MMTDRYLISKASVHRTIKISNVCHWKSLVNTVINRQIPDVHRRRSHQLKLNIRQSSPKSKKIYNIVSIHQPMIHRANSIKSNRKTIIRIFSHECSRHIPHINARQRRQQQCTNQNYVR